MKKIILILTLVLLLTSLTSARQSITNPDNSYRINLLSFDPSPVTVGSNSQVNLEFVNLLDIPIKRISIKASEKYPIIIKDEKQTYIPEIPPRKSTTFSYNLSIDKSGFEGIYPLGLEIEADILNKINVATFEINVKRLTRGITSTNVRTIPEKIMPGKQAELQVNIVNNADFAITDILIDLNFDDTPIAPILSTSKKELPIIEAHSVAQVDYTIVALPETKSNVYKIPLTMTFNDKNGDEIIREGVIGILIGADPDYNIDLEEGTLINGVQQDITLSISNRGSEELKFLTIELEDGKNYQTLNKKRTYLGNLEADDFETVEFTIIGKQNFIKKIKNTNIKLKLDYKDNFNKDYTDEITVNLPLYSKSQARAYSLIPQSKLSGYLFILIFIILIYITYKQWKKERDLGKAIKHTLYIAISWVFIQIKKLRWRYLRRIPRKIQLFFIKI